ncbi:hypothetical protein [Streptomyces sp. NPDC001450]
MASRRQIGGQSARVRVLAQQVKRTERLLDALEALVGGPTAACRTPDEGTGRRAAADGHGDHGDHGTTGDTDTDCLRCAMAALLRRHRDATP